MLAPASLPYEINVGLGLAFTRMGIAGRQRLGIDCADHVIESLVGEGCLVGLAGDGLASVGLALGVHCASPQCRGVAWPCARLVARTNKEVQSFVFRDPDHTARPA